jgi:hypothetical protein
MWSGDPGGRVIEGSPHFIGGSKLQEGRDDDLERRGIQYVGRTHEARTDTRHDPGSRLKQNSRLSRTADLRHCHAGTVESDKHMVTIAKRDFRLRPPAVTKLDYCTGAHDLD